MATEPVLHSEKIPFDDGFRVNEYMEVRNAALPNGISVSGNIIDIDARTGDLLFIGHAELDKGVILTCRGVDGVETATATVAFDGDTFVAFGPDECHFLVKDDSLKAFAGGRSVAQISLASGNRYTGAQELSSWGRGVHIYLNSELPQIYYMENDNVVGVYASSPGFAVDEGSLPLLAGEFFERHGMNETPFVAGLDDLWMVGKFFTACREVMQFNPRLFDHVDRFYFDDAPLYILSALALIPKEARSRGRGICSHNPFFHSVYCSVEMSSEALVHEMTHAKDWTAIGTAMDIHWSNISPKFSRLINFPIYAISTRMSDGDEEPPAGHVSSYAAIDNGDDMAETVRCFAKGPEEFSRRYLSPFSPKYDPVIAEKVRLLIRDGYIPADKVPMFARDYVELRPVE